ncbi:serine hydrolase [Candidatus Woesearchaeota archaeon]|nr:serine hydrolase [Candidatus Woesearchaeota archaeon]
MEIKGFAVFEAIVILVLSGALIYMNMEQSTVTTEKITSAALSNDTKLLSSRIYSGILEPQSYLILNYEPLQEELKQNIEKNNLTISVYVENLRSGAHMSINGNQTYLSASMMKIPLAILVMKKIERGEMTLDTPLAILDNDKTDTWGTLYNTTAQYLTVRQLLDRMLEDSDNTALNILYRNIDQDDFENLVYKYYGFQSNSVTTISFYNLFSSLYLSTVLEPQDSEYILQMLTKTTFNLPQIADLPEDVVIAHKFGSRYKDDEKYFHDCGIIYDKELRIFYCIMTKDLEQDTAIQVSAYLLNRIYIYSVQTRIDLDNYKQAELLSNNSK